MTTQTELNTAYHAVRRYVNEAAGMYASYVTDEMVMNITKTALGAAEGVRKSAVKKDVKKPVKK